jgi:uncharacterized protein (DUF302 family)
MSLRDDLRTTQSKAQFDDVVERLRDIIRDRGLTLFAEVDQARNAREAGLAMPKTVVLIFGNARGGTPLMLAAPDIALELPLRILVRERDETHVDLVYIDPERLTAAFGIGELAPAIAGLGAIVDAAASPASTSTL